MPIQFENKTMTFLPPQKRFGEQEIDERDELKCDHLGTKHTYVHGRWECCRCGEVIR